MIAQGIAELEKRANENDPVVPMLKYIWLDGGSIRGE